MRLAAVNNRSVAEKAAHRDPALDNRVLRISIFEIRGEDSRLR